MNQNVNLRLTRAQTKILMALFTDRLEAIRKPIPLPEAQVRVMQECLRQAKQ